MKRCDFRSIDATATGNGINVETMPELQITTGKMWSDWAIRFVIYAVVMGGVFFWIYVLDRLVARVFG
jgi:hypothetical protein